MPTDFYQGLRATLLHCTYDVIILRRYCHMFTMKHHQVRVKAMALCEQMLLSNL